MVDILCTHYQHLHLVTKEGFTIPLNLSPGGRLWHSSWV